MFSIKNWLDGQWVNLLTTPLGTCNQKTWKLKWILIQQQKQQQPKDEKGFDVHTEDNKEFGVFSNKHFIVDIRIPHAFWEIYFRHTNMFSWWSSDYVFT